MSISMKGLRLKPTYEDLIGVAVSDDLQHIKFPNRSATFLRNGFVLSQLDGEGMRSMVKQQEMASKEAFKESLFKQIAINTGSNIHDLRNDSNQENRTERVNNVIGPLPDFLHGQVLIWQKMMMMMMIPHMIHRLTHQRDQLLITQIE